MPAWVPTEARRYLYHTEDGRSIRALARDADVHASTILRQVRRFESRRDDQLVDHAVLRLAGKRGRGQNQITGEGRTPMGTTELDRAVAPPDDDTIGREARRILRRLSEPGACLAVARDMENAVVVRETSDGRTVRTGVVERHIAEALALREWIECATTGRISRYHITAQGRAALKRFIAEDDAARTGSDPNSFADQHRDFDVKTVGTGQGQSKRVRYNAAESPLLTLSRRRDKDGTAFLSPDLVAAGERLREDFELAQMGPRITQNWDKFLTSGVDGGGPKDGGVAQGPSGARDRVTNALADLGPGLGDVVLRCCCFLEGMEAAERRMGWSARSGKIVLRIALQRLKRHYDEQSGNWSPMIG
ncbi:MAG: DUF6456 domain-containing protein [Pseudomonadota bacterium]